jgi:hypothetical protein
VYIEPQNGFETYLAATASKKNVPVDVVADPTKATYLRYLTHQETVRHGERDGL